MGYEIDFLTVGDASKSGDAIALRWGDLVKGNDSQFVAVIDGGFKDDGEKLAALIEEYYGNLSTIGNRSAIDLVVSTHPDADHISGLSHILEKFAVKTLWLHQPWEHNEGLASRFEDGRVNDDSIGRRLKESCAMAWELVKQAKRNGTIVQEPFAHREINQCEGRLRVLGPTEGYYEELLTDFDGMPETATAGQAIVQSTKDFLNRCKELWDDDSIGNGGETSAKNNSSVILEFVYDGNRSLFTADAGIPALQNACGLAGEEALRFIQIPHHGSRRNVGSDVLDKLVGKIVGKGLPRGQSSRISAYASCAPKNPDNKHPSKRVLNAFKRRGCNCYVTAEGKQSMCHFHGANRKGYSSMTPCEFYEHLKEGE